MDEPRAGRVTRLARLAQGVQSSRDGLAAQGGRAQGTQGPRRPLALRSPFALGFMGAVGALLAFWLAQRVVQIGSILILVVVAMFLAVGLNPLVEFFVRLRIRRSVALILVAVLVLAAITGFVIAIVPVISDQVTALVDNVPTWIHDLRNNQTIKHYDQKYDILNKLQDALTGGSIAKKVFGGVVGVGLAVLGAIVNIFIVIVLTVYFLGALPAIKRGTYSLVPASNRERVTELGDRILANVGAYVIGAFVVAMCAGLSSLVFLFLVGLGAYAVALSLVVTVLDVIPMIGATLGAVVVTLIGFATDPRIGLFCLIFYVLYQQVENYLIYPRVMARSVNVPGWLIVVAALIGASLLGVIGALLAIPVAAAILLIVREVVIPRQQTR
ncbi:MAG TPA: AI-2E family transporter [Nocardioidaceae bacterium]|nr:AI-2E family transporter [Nocardioidaceae bacterium]